MRDGGEGRAVAAWLFTCCALVAVMVGLGGMTRLTGSGLSMVEWQPHVLLPPLGHDEWMQTFAKYRESPQYRLVNSGMDLAGFQGIFWLEYIHRLWGRMIGVAFLLPLVVFAARGMVGRPLLRRLGLLFALGALQGGLGWFMVASGLVDRPEVSHFRLAAHLLMAFLILAAMLWTALDLAQPPRPARGASALRPWIGLVLALAVVTVAWGALVAGRKAGLVYDTFPLMNGRLFPDDGGTDILHDHGAVQFTHRLLAVTTVLSASALWLGSRRLELAPPTRAALAAAAAWAWCQGALGVSTLLLHVPPALATAHQMGAVALVGLLVWALHSTGRAADAA